MITILCKNILGCCVFSVYIMTVYLALHSDLKKTTENIENKKPTLMYNSHPQL